MDKQRSLNDRTYDLQVLRADGTGLHVTAKESVKLVHDQHVGSERAGALEVGIDEVIPVFERQLIRGGGVSYPTSPPLPGARTLIAMERKLAAILAADVVGLVSHGDRRGGHA